MDNFLPSNREAEGLPSRIPSNVFVSIRRWRLQLAVVGSAVVFAVGSVTATLFFLLHASTHEEALDFVKVGLAAGAGVGALMTLMMAIRRQLLAEESADEAKLDSRERRTVDLFIKGLERFGADKEEIRVGGLYALERLGENEPSLREQIVDVVCTYLRARPKTGRTSDALGPLADACMKFLQDHMAFGSTHAYHKTYWPLELADLSGAVMRYGSWAAIKVDTFHFRGTVFLDEADFEDAVIRGANFGRAEFRGDAIFRGAWLGKGVFENARFRGRADFRSARFLIDVDFSGATFRVGPLFDGALVAVTEDRGGVVLPTGWQLSTGVINVDSTPWWQIEREARIDRSNGGFE